MVSSVYAHSAIVSALLERTKTKQGSFIDMPMANGLAHMVQVWQRTTLTTDLLAWLRIREWRDSQVTLGA